VRIIDSGPLVATLEVVRSFGSSTMTTRTVVRAGSARVDLQFDIDWHEDEQLLSVMVPMAVHAREAACDIQFGHVMRPTHTSTSWDAAKFEVCAHRYVDISEPGWGVAVLNDGRYGHGVQDGGVRVSLLRAAKFPDPVQDHGRHSVTVAVMPHSGGLAEVVREAEFLNVPLREVLPGNAAAAPAPLVELTGTGVEVSAVKRADDGSGDLVVRLAEMCGARTPVTVRLPKRIDDARRCTLLEEPLAAIDTGDGIVAVTLQPFELLTLRLR
jgi:alpha-mannosidase